MPARDRLGALEVLKEWGYTKSLNATRPLEPLVNGLDRDTFLLVEKLIHDLSDEKRKSSEGRLHIAQLKENLKLEEKKVREVQGDIHQHSTRIETLEHQPGFGEKAVDTINDRQKSDGDHVQQWKAQSLHRIEELERMNQALRSTLNLHSSCFGPEGQDVSSSHQTAHMELSTHLEPKKSKGKTMVNGKGTAVPKLDLFRVSEKKCKDLENELRQMKENEASLKSQILVTQEQLAKKGEEINCLSSLVKKVKDGNHGDINLPPLSGDISSTNGGDHIHDELQVLHNRIIEQESTLTTLHANVTQKQEQLIFLTDEKIAGEESLQACQNECRQLAACIKELDESMAQLSELLATRTAERDHAIACEQQAVEAQVHSEEDFKKNVDSISFELETSHAKLEMLQSELDKLMKEREEEKEKFRVVTAKLQEQGMRLKSTEKDMEQLKLLVTQLDTTREHLVEKLKSSFEQNQQTNEHCRTMETEMHRLAEEAEIRNKDISDLQALIEPMGKQKKHLQAEIISLKERLSTEEEANKSSEAKYSAKILELRSVTESLTKMSCEQQLLKSDLQHVMMERENLVDELRNMKSKLSFSEQLIYSRDQEGAEMLNSYQKLCEDYEQLKLAAGQVETENQQLHFQLRSMEEHLYRRNQEVKSLEDGTQRQASEIKRLEREASLMSRSMSQQSGLVEDYRKEKASLSAQLGALKQAASELEHAHESISREVAAFATKNQFLASLAQERTQEIETLTTQYNLESERTKELERLLACVRMESKDVVREYGMMRDRSFSLEDQVRTLQVTRDVQSKEIMRLQALILHNNTNPEEDNKRARMVSTSSQTVDNEVDSSSELSILKAKAHELEMRNISLASDLSKTVALYEECLKKLQNAEMQCNQQKREHDQILLLLSKVDEERMVLRKRCVELGSGPEPSDAPKGA